MDTDALGDVIGIKHGWPFKSELFSEELTGRPIVVAVGNYQYTGGFRFDSTTVKEYLGEYPFEYELSPGDILLVMTCQTPGGEILGVPACIPNDGRLYLHNQRLGKVVVKKPDSVDPSFLYWVFLSKLFNRELCASASGTKIVHTAPTRIEAYQFDLPPVPEQQAIACILGALDDKIELNRRRNRTLEAMALAIFQSWFVDFDPVKAKATGRAPVGLSPDLAGLFSDSFDDSGRGQIPKGWRACRWGDIATLEYGKSLRDYAEADGPFRVYGTNGPIGWHTESLCDGPGVVIGRKGAYRGIHYSPKPFFVIDTAFYLKPKTSIDLKWAYYELLKCDINGMDSGSAIPSTNRGDFYAIPVYLPAAGVLRAFGHLTQPIYDRRDAAESENVTLAALRDALLPKLISGEMRVPDAERIVGRAV